MKKLILSFVVLMLVACVGTTNQKTSQEIRPKTQIVVLSPKRPETLKTEGLRERAVYIIFHNSEDEVLKTGSGVFVRVENDNNIYVLTAAHVVINARIPDWSELDGKPTIVVKGYKDPDVSTGEIVAINKELDVALLKIKQHQQANYPYYAELDTDSLNPGDYLYTIGNPGRYKYLFTEGALATDEYPRMEQSYITSVPVDGGSSGGGLFNQSGRISGIITHKIIHNPGFPAFSAATKSSEISIWLNSNNITLE
jgi:S1-C subfamily serine protease